MNGQECGLSHLCIYYTYVIIGSFKWCSNAVVMLATARGSMCFADLVNEEHAMLRGCGARSKREAQPSLFSFASPSSQLYKHLLELIISCQTTVLISDQRRLAKRLKI